MNLMFSRRLLLAMVFILSSGGAIRAADVPEARQAPDLERVVRVIDTLAGKEITLQELARRLALADMVFLGETHLDRTTHRLQHWLYDELLARRKGRVVLAMEMFERDVQSVVDDYLADRIDRAAFLEKSRPWSNYRSDYEPMVVAAKRAKAPVIAANFPRWLARKIRDRESLEAISEEERRWVPTELFPNSAAYWNRFDRAVRGHLGGASQTPEERIYSTQCLWDNAMGEACALALERFPDHQVVHVNGGFHTAHGEGTAAQFARRRPSARMVTVQINPTSDLASIRAPGDSDDRESGDEAPGEDSPAEADYVAYVEARARSLQEGTHAVQISREFEYYVRAPKETKGPLPLLVWMHREGLRATDALRYMELAFDEPMVLVAIQAPFPQLEEDLYLGGRWYWDGDFSEHVGSVRSGLVRLLGRLHEDYDIDPKRSLLVGEGTAATVVASAMLYGRELLPVQAIALRPREFGKLRQAGLPDPAETNSNLPPQLRVLIGTSGRGWWEKEAEDYRSTGLRVILDDAPKSLLGVEQELREWLGLPALPAPTQSRWVKLRHGSPRVRFWADLEVRAWIDRGIQAFLIEPEGASGAESSDPESSDPGVAPSVLALPGESGEKPFLDPTRWKGALRVPQPPGPFGGTTVLVTFPGLSEEQRAAWIELAALRIGSRFYRTVVAHVDQEPSLGTVFQELAAQGRNNIMVVPAAFCATAEEMRALRDAVDPWVSESASVHWSPGLGGQLYRRHESDGQ